MANNVSVRIGSKFDKSGVEQANRGLTGMRDTAQQVSSSINKNFVLTAAKIYAAVKAVQAFYNQLNRVVEKYEQQDDAERKLIANARNNPYVNGQGVKNLKAFASQMQALTRYGDEQIIQQEQWLVSLRFTEDQIERIITASADLASTGMFSLDSAVRNLSKTYSGLVGELGEAIPQLRELTAEQLKAGAAVEIVARQYAGLAEAARQGAAGQREAFENLAGDVQEQIGSIFAALRNKLYAELTPVLEGLQSWFERNAPVIYSVFAQLPKIAAQAWQTAVEIMGKAFTGDTALQILTLFAQYVKESLKLGISTFPLLLRAILGVAEDLWRSFGDNAGKYLVNGLVNAITSGPRAVARLLGFEDVGAKIDLFNIQGIREQDFREFLNAASTTLNEVGREVGYQIKDQMQNYRNLLGGIGNLFGDEVDHATLAIIELIDAGILEFEAFRLAADAAGDAMPGGGAGAGGGSSAAAAGASPYSNTFGQLGAFLTSGDPTVMLVQAVASAALEIEAVSEVLNGLNLALSAFFDVIDGPLTAVLDPVVDLLILLGDSLGKLLAPIIGALAPIIGVLATVLSSILIPIFQLLSVVLSPLVVVLQVLQPLFIHIAAALETVLSPLKFFGDLMAWIGEAVRAFGQQLSLVLQGKFRQAGNVTGPGAFSSDAFSGLYNRIEAIYALGDQSYNDVGDFGDFGGSNTYGGDTTVQRQPDINVYLTFQGPVVGEGGMQAVGEFCADAISDFLAAGGRVTFIEA